MGSEVDGAGVHVHKGEGRLTAPSSIHIESIHRQSSLSEYVPTFSIAGVNDARKRSEIPNTTTSRPSLRSSVEKTQSSSSITSNKSSTINSRAHPDDVHNNNYTKLDSARSKQALPSSEVPVLDLLECPHCQRKFAEKPYEKHVRICEKVRIITWLSKHRISYSNHN